MANLLQMTHVIDDVESHWLYLWLYACSKDELGRDMRYAGAWLLCTDGCLSI